MTGCNEKIFQLLQTREVDMWFNEPDEAKHREIVSCFIDGTVQALNSFIQGEIKKSMFFYCSEGTLTLQQPVPGS